MSHLLSAVKFALLGALLLTGAWNCRKDVDEFRPYVYPASQASIALLLDQVTPPATVTTFLLKELTHDTLLTTPGGVRVGLTDTEALFANANNEPVAVSTCQNLQVKVTEVLSKSDLLARGIHTAIHPGGQLLESGGIVNVQITCDGSPLQLLPNRSLKVQVPANELKSDMLAFQEAEPGNPDFSGWQATGDPAYLAEWVNDASVLHGYELYPSQLGWVGAGRPLPEATSQLCVQLPTGMTDQTARVFLVFKGFASVVSLPYDAATQSFCFDQAPEGYPVQVVVISKLGADYWLGHQETETGTNTSFYLEPHKTTEADLLAFLKNL